MMKPAEKLNHEEVSIPKLVREAIDSSDGTVMEASFTLKKMVLDDAALVSSLLDMVVDDWADYRVRKELTSRRTYRLGGVRTVPDTNIVEVDGAVFRNAINANAARMMDVPLWGGKRLGDATAEEIRQSAENYRTNGNNMLHKARWQFAVADAADKNKLGDKDRIRDILSEATISKLWEETSGN